MAWKVDQTYLVLASCKLVLQKTLSRIFVANKNSVADPGSSSISISFFQFYSISSMMPRNSKPSGEIKSCGKKEIIQRPCQVSKYAKRISLGFAESILCNKHTRMLKERERERERM